MLSVTDIDLLNSWACSNISRLTPLEQVSSCFDNQKLSTMAFPMACTHTCDVNGIKYVCLCVWGWAVILSFILIAVAAGKN